MRVLRAFEIVAFVLVSVASVSVYARRACVHHRPQEVNGCNARNVRNACNRGGGRTIGRTKCVPSSAERPDAEMPISRSISSPSIESWYLKPAERPREMVMVAPVEPTWGGDRRV